MSNARRMYRLAALAALVPFAACSDILSLDEIGRASCRERV